MCEPCTKETQLQHRSQLRSTQPGSTIRKRCLWCWMHVELLGKEMEPRNFLLNNSAC